MIFGFLRFSMSWEGTAADSDRVIAKDFEDVGGSDLSETDEELLIGSQALKESPGWTQTLPSRFYYKRVGSLLFPTYIFFVGRGPIAHFLKDGITIRATDKLEQLQKDFHYRLFSAIDEIKRNLPSGEQPPPQAVAFGKCKCGQCIFNMR